MTRRVRAPRHRPLREPGDGLGEAVVVRSGLLALYVTVPGGRRRTRRIVALRFPGDVVLPDRPPQIGIEPLLDSDVEIEPAKSFLEHWSWRKHARRNELIGYYWIARLAGMDASTRLANLLCEIAARGGHGDRFELPLTQIEMADITGQTDINANRVLRELEEGGLIERHGREVTVPDLEALWRRAAFHVEHLNG